MQLQSEQQLRKPRSWFWGFIVNKSREDDILDPEKIEQVEAEFDAKESSSRLEEATRPKVQKFGWRYGGAVSRNTCIVTIESSFSIYDSYSFLSQLRFLYKKVYW